MRFDLKMLGPEDACAFQALRLDALARHPCAFAAAHDEESGQSAADVAERLAAQAVFGGFEGRALIGVAGFATPTLAKKRHKGVLWGVYVSARQRGHGLGRALVTQVIEHARGRVAQLHAAVVTGNAIACELYRDLGFVTYGVEPRALKVAERYFDQELMVLMLDDGR
jgi:ribosomal protein S18 acetylase RimI-like enzyme